MNYKNINDYELIYLIREEDENYKSIIYQKYEPLIRKITHKYSNLYNLDEDDINQEAFIALEHAIKTFKSSKQVVFYTYAYQCIRNRLIDYIRKNIKFINDTVSLYQTIDDNIFLLDVLTNGDITYKDILIKDNIKDLIMFKNSLNNIESLVFELKYNGFKHKEISCLLDISMSKVNNYLMKIKRKLEKCKYEDCFF